MTRPARILAATFLTAAAVLSTEIILTRVFSVLMWYHFAFLAISVCLFGMAVGSLALHLFGRNLREDDLPIHLGRAAIGFAATQFLCVVVLRFLKYGDMNIGAAFAAKMALTFLVCAAPFAFAGFFLGLVFSRGAARIGGIYFADLAGASLGCLLTIALLTHFGGESALLAAAFIALCGGLVAGRISFTRPVFLQQLGAAAVVVALIAANQYTGFLNVRHSKGNDEPEPAAVGWNSFSRVIAYPRPDVGDIMLKIDGIAHTPITPFHGDAAVTQDPAGYIQRVPFAFYDNPSVLIVGSGGGEHILTALAENASPVVGIEMNPIVIDMVERRFADVGGGLFHYPGVRVELAEGRSYIARTQERFDVISFTLIDTWAATAGGAFSLTENYLFTMRSFDEYLDHLSDRGMIAIKRWRDAEDYVLRMVLLGRAALEARGQTKPENCIFVAADDSFVNILIKKQPFTMNEMMRALGVVEKFGLKTLYAPYLGDGDERMRDMIRTTDLAGWLAGQEQDLSPPTDDKPFFFNTVRPAHLLDAFKQSWSSKIRNVGTLILLLVFAIVSVLVLALIGGPLLFMKKHRMLLGANLRAAFYFALIGLGFLTIEIALMQSFILYLGHPTLTLSVFLATLLVSGAAGSAASSALGRERPKRTAVIVAILIASVALAIRAASPQIFAATLGLPTVARGLITAAMVFPLGFLMGIPFPLGVRAVREDETVPWMFAVNSAASVLGSVAAVAIAMAAGFSVTTAVALAAYLAAAVAFPSPE